MIVQFTHYMHDDDYDIFMESIRDAGVEPSEELMEKIGRPFYEVCLNCELNTETGAVRIVSAG